MAVEDIAGLPVKAMAATDSSGQRSDGTRTCPRDGSTLYLWTTTAYLETAYTVCRAWGFNPGPVLVWCKPPVGAGGPGGTFKANVEFIITGRRGQPRVAVGDVGTRWFTWPRGEHSRKPDAFLDLVESISQGPYLELFARRQRLGWDTWGNEALQNVEMSA